MRPISTIEEISFGLEKVKSLKKGLLTNFFSDPVRTRLWLNKDLMRLAEIGETVFLFRKNQGFWNLYYISSGLASLEKDLDSLGSRYDKETFVVDLVGKEDIHAVRAVFLNGRFSEYTVLYRMSRTVDAPDVRNAGEEHLSYAGATDLAGIFLLFREYFDPMCEQVPLMEELAAWAEKKQILTYSDDKTTIQAFLIYEVTGKTSYLRYWFVHPGHREKKIGSKLIYKFFKESGPATRQLFWVIGSNGNAIKRYEHYGFQKEPFYDHVLINRDKKYEGQNN